MFLTIPTLLTWARIVAIPLIVGVFNLPLVEAERNLIATVLKANGVAPSSYDSSQPIDAVLA